jgi:endonuclease YncB( thermonuclease family)
MGARIFMTAIIVLALGPAQAQTPCGGGDLGTVTLKTVRDARTLALADGRALRLAAVEVAPAGEAMLRALEGRTLSLRAAGEAQDRYGRIVAFATAADTARSVQEALLSAGKARVSSRIGGKACAEALLTLERQARAAGLGLWADPNFAPLRPDDTARFRTEWGRFVLVEGKVLSVRESGAVIYVNFGRRFTRDLSLIILRRLRPEFAAARLEPRALQGRRIRVRGWLERRRGPILEVAAPEQIEVIE